MINEVIDLNGFLVTSEALAASGKPTTEGVLSYTTASYLELVDRAVSESNDFDLIWHLTGNRYLAAGRPEPMSCINHKINSVSEPKGASLF